MPEGLFGKNTDTMKRRANYDDQTRTAGGEGFLVFVDSGFQCNLAGGLEQFPQSCQLGIYTDWSNQPSGTALF
jgi:hypothetical protein